MADDPPGLTLRSKLPATGTTIFTTMSGWAQQYGAINLGQGFPDYEIDPDLIDLVRQAMYAGHNQYAPMAGVMGLRERISAKVERLYQRGYDPEHEITITAGATQAIFSAIQTLAHPGGEVIVFEPAYDSYIPSIQMAGAMPKPVKLTFPGYHIDWPALRNAISPRTQLIVVNTPNNPGTSILCPEDLNQLAEVVRGTNIVVVSDEVYEHMVYDGRRHESLARHPELNQRSVVIGSFGKTFHATGWKVGYALAAPEITAEIRRAHQFTVFAVNTPVQHALAEFLRVPERWETLTGFFSRKRDFLRSALADTRLDLLPCEGSYFQLAYFGRLSDESSMDFCERLVKKLGIATIPLSAFYQDQTDHQIVRFCFAKRDETLQAGVEKLQALRS